MAPMNRLIRISVLVFPLSAIKSFPQITIYLLSSGRIISTPRSIIAGDFTMALAREAALGALSRNQDSIRP